MKLSRLTVSLCLLFIAGCATEPNLYTGKTGYYAYTWDQELALGKDSDRQIVQQMGVYPDDAINDYVTSIGKSLLAKSAIRSQESPDAFREAPFTFRVLDSPVVNAFALPGGYVYVTRGLLAHIENEAQLAVVIGHEITHVEARHASKQALKQQWGQIGLVAGSLIGEQFTENKELARSLIDVSGSLFQLLTLKYGRDAERESDLHGVEYAAKAGWDASQGSAFFRSLKRISEKSGQSIPSWMSTHPDPGEREQTILELSQHWHGNLQSAEQDVGRRRFLEKVDGLVVGENPRHGFALNGRFYHPDFRWQIDIPTSWKAQNEAAAVYLAEPNGQALIMIGLSKQPDPYAAAQDFIARLSLQSPYSQRLDVNGLPAHEVEGNISNGTESIPIYSLFVEQGDQVYGILGYGTSASFAANRSSIRRSAQSFQEMTDRSLLSIQPARLQVVAAPRTAPFQDLLPKTLPSGMDSHDWAIINQVELDETIAQGTLLKLPK